MCLGELLLSLESTVRNDDETSERYLFGILCLIIVSYSMISIKKLLEKDQNILGLTAMLND